MVGHLSRNISTMSSILFGAGGIIYCKVSQPAPLSTMLIQYYKKEKTHWKTFAIA